MTYYTFEDVKRVLHEIVAERPDYVYEPPAGFGGLCVYADSESNPSCLWGHVIQRVDPDAFASMAVTYAWSDAVPAISALGWAQQFTIVEQRAMRQSQVMQDMGGTWAEAEREFEKWTQTVGAFDAALEEEGD